MLFFNLKLLIDARNIARKRDANSFENEKHCKSTVASFYEENLGFANSHSVMKRERGDQNHPYEVRKLLYPNPVKMNEEELMATDKVLRSVVSYHDSAKRIPRLPKEISLGTHEKIGHTTVATAYNYRGGNRFRFCSECAGRDIAPNQMAHECYRFQSGLLDDDLKDEESSPSNDSDADSEDEDEEEKQLVDTVLAFETFRRFIDKQYEALKNDNVRQELQSRKRKFDSR